MVINLITVLRSYTHFIFNEDCLFLPGGPRYKKP